MNGLQLLCLCVLLLRISFDGKEYPNPSDLQIDHVIKCSPKIIKLSFHSFCQLLLQDNNANKSLLQIVIMIIICDIILMLKIDLGYLLRRNSRKKKQLQKIISKKIIKTTKYANLTINTDLTEPNTKNVVTIYLVCVCFSFFL